MNAGFLPNVYFPAAKKELPAVVIPNDLGGVYFRSISGKFHKNNQPMATTTIFLPDTDNFDIVITEGKINAASIFQAVVSVTHNFPKFAIMAGSGTGAGQKATVDTIKRLKNASFDVLDINITKTPDIDLNNALNAQNGDYELLRMILEALSQAENDFKKIDKENYQSQCPNFQFFRFKNYNVGI